MALKSCLKYCLIYQTIKLIIVRFKYIFYKIDIFLFSTNKNKLQYCSLGHSAHD